jgi:hypothetical protein
MPTADLCAAGALDDVAFNCRRWHGEVEFSAEPSVAERSGSIIKAGVGHFESITMV